MFDIKQYLTKKKKNGGSPENDKIMDIMTYSYMSMLLHFNSDTYFICNKLKKNK